MKPIGFIMNRFLQGTIMSGWVKCLIFVSLCSILNNAFADDNQFSRLKELRALYQIDDCKRDCFRNRNALDIVFECFSEHPELKMRLLDPKSTVAGKKWGYFDQAYEHEETMLHVVSLQVKAMVEREEVKSTDQLFDDEFGIGSKFHKDKGTINNIFSLWGHPVRTELLQGSSKNTHYVYEQFRLTIKNDLVRFVRGQSLDWHLQSDVEKKKQTLEFLEKNVPEATLRLNQQLLEINLSLELLIDRVLVTNLLS